MASPPPLGLHAEVTLADGTKYRWDAGKAADTPQGISFRTKKGEGFADASLTLSRRIDRDYVDLNLYDDFALIGYDGSVAYEGRVAANPRSLGEQSHQMSVVLQGWMSHAKDRKFSQVYVDRDTGNWQSPSLTRLAEIYSNGYKPGGPFSSSTNHGLVFSVAANTAIEQNQIEELVYTMPSGAKAGIFGYKGTETGSVPGETPTLYASDNEDMTGADSYALTLDGVLRSEAIDPPRRFLTVRVYFGAAASTTDDESIARTFSAVAVYEDHGLERVAIDSDTPDGLYASDALTDIISRFCPKLTTAGIEDTSYAIPRLVFGRAFPYDAFLEINKYHLWDFGVYEDKAFYFKPHDYTDYDWEIRLSDPGVTVDLQGDSVGDFANGIVVTYTDVDTGKTTVITPDDNSDLADSDPANPANAHGLTVWTEITLSSPTTSAAATQIGRAALAEFNQAKAPGTIRVTGHIRDRAGHPQQVWKVRAGDRLIISDHPNDRVRLVNETDYSHDSKTVSIAVDSAFMRLDAALDRVSTALQAANLS